MAVRFMIPDAPLAVAAGDELGGARVGEAGGPVAWPEQQVRAPLLGGWAVSRQEIWRVAGLVSAGEQEGIRWRRAGHLLYGVLDLDEALFAGQDVPPLQAASEAAYRRIFRLLEAQGLPHLWRAWNYMARINEETGGLERYRQFNIGRQDAFIAHQRGTTGNMPAACAIGLAEGGLSIAFLAGPVPAVPVENPRQVSAYDYPADYGPRSPSFSRAALAYPEGQELLFVSGTASIVGHQTVHPGDVLKQCDETLANIAAVLEEANRMARSGPFALPDLSYRVYVRHERDFPLIQARLQDRLGLGAEITYLQGDICRADLLLEIEAQGIHELPGADG